MASIDPIATTSTIGIGSRQRTRWRPLRGSCLAAALLLCSTEGLQASPAGHHPARLQHDGWITSCSPGTDGFAANCESHKLVGPLRLHIAVSDAQFVLSVEAANCSAVMPFYVYRDQLFSMSARERRRMMVAVFGWMARELRSRCGQLAPFDERQFAHPPDLATARADDLR